MSDTDSKEGADMFAMSCQGVDHDISKAVYHFLKHWRPKHYVSADDDLARIYGIVDDDLDDAVLELARRTGSNRPLSGRIGTKPVQSARDLAELIHYLRDNRRDI